MLPTPGFRRGSSGSGTSCSARPRHDVHLIALPLFRSFGQVVQMNAGIAPQATPVLLPRFDAPSALALMQRHAVTFFGGVPTMYWALLEAEASDVDPARISTNLRLAVSGAQRHRKDPQARAQEPRRSHARVRTSIRSPGTFAP
ncbi:AMP-binding protein [Streptomyces sp. NBC_01220]|uniref:AMP-binding protein n=1 Tax=Streptomyces sp. NBC_01220 TaxID=2903781 RepID=UPI00352D628D|nr:AMP-binding protein [Streptomyces sp. NBC_01220]